MRVTQSAWKSVVQHLTSVVEQFDLLCHRRATLRVGAIVILYGTGTGASTPIFFQIDWAEPIPVSQPGLEELHDFLKLFGVLRRQIKHLTPQEIHLLEPLALGIESPLHPSQRAAGRYLRH